MKSSSLSPSQSNPIPKSSLQWTPSRSVHASTNLRIGQSSKDELICPSNYAVRTEYKSRVTIVLFRILPRLRYIVALGTRTPAMSQSNDPTNQEILKLLQAILAESYISIALAALPVYEYLITFDQEVDLVWSRKTRFSVPAILLVSTRVCMVISAILAVTTPQNSCMSVEAFNILGEIIDSVGFIQIALFSALRVSALYGGNIALFIGVMTLGFVPVGTNVFKDVRLTYVQQAGTCIEGLRVSDALARKLVFVTRVPVIATDLLVLLLTWAKTYKQVILSRGIGISVPLSACLARDGTMYFLALLSLNILQLATHTTQAGNPTNTTDQYHSTASTLRFQLSSQIVGSMGAPLDHEGLARHGGREDEVDVADDIQVEAHDCDGAERQGSPERSMAGGSAAALVSTFQRIGTRNHRSSHARQAHCSTLYIIS